MEENLRQLIQDMEDILRRYDGIEREGLDPYVRGKLDTTEAIQRRLELILMTQFHFNQSKE